MLMLNTKQKHPGFTIVELLIVIVVIAILASITVIAYRGIRERAVTVAYTSAVDQWDKFLQIEVATVGYLPTTSGSVCLGSSAEDFPAEGDFPAGACMRDAVGSFVSYSSSFFDSLQTDVGIPTSGLLPTTNFLGVRSRGIMVSASGAEYTLVWVPQVTGQCGRGQPFYNQEAGLLTGDYCTLERSL